VQDGQLLIMKLQKISIILKPLTLESAPARNLSKLRIHKIPDDWMQTLLCELNHILKTLQLVLNNLQCFLINLHI